MLTPESVVGDADADVNRDGTSDEEEDDLLADDYKKRKAESRASSSRPAASAGASSSSNLQPMKRERLLPPHGGSLSPPGEKSSGESLGQAEAHSRKPMKKRRTLKLSGVFKKR